MSVEEESRRWSVENGRYLLPVPAGDCGRRRRRGASVCCLESRGGIRPGNGACGCEQRNVIGSEVRDEHCNDCVDGVRGR